MLNFLPKQLFLIDPLALFFLAVIAFSCVPSAIFSIGYMKDETPRKKVLAWALLPVFALSMCMVAVSGNIFSFLIFWEMMSLASYFLVIFDHKHEKSVRAGIIYLVMTHAGTACIMAAFFLLYNAAGTFDYSAIKQAAVSLSPGTRNTIFFLLLTGFSAKAGAVPLHIWLPYAHPQAPSHISSIMSGVMIKIAIYGMIRFFVVLLSPAPAWWGAIIIGLGSLSCLVGIIYALMDRDIKKLLAYSSVENIGVILLSAGAAMFFKSQGLEAAAALAMCAGLYHVINHALFKGLLFLCAGSVYKATGLRDMEKMGGLIRVMPATALFFLVGAMGISALPPLNGFVGEWLAFQALFAGILQLAGWAKMLIVLSAAALALTSGLTAACFVKAFGIAFLAMPRSKRAQEAKEAGPSMKAGMGLMAALVVLFGVCSGVIAPVIFSISQGTLGIEKTGTSFYLISVLPPAIALFLAVSGAAIFLWFKFGLRTAQVRYNTWDCGYYELDSRNEYTATAFSKPFRIAFSFFLLPYRKSGKIRDSFYHVREFTYETHTTPVFKRYFYEPLLRSVYAAALWARRLQPGSIHLYLLYIFAALLCLLVITAVF